MVLRRSLLASVPAVGLAGCLGDGGSDENFTPPPSPTPPAGRDAYWYTHPQPTGNRHLAGAGNVRDADPVTLDVSGTPKWLVAYPGDGGSRWAVVTEDGQATRWRVADGGATREGQFSPLPRGTPPVVATEGSRSYRVELPPGMADTGSPTVDPGEDGADPRLLYVSKNGDLVVVGEETTRLPVDAPADARLAAVGDGRYALFGDATDRYEHGALGDTVEGSSLVVVDPVVPEVQARSTLEPPAVFEGLQPLVADLDGDGDPEIVTTLADSENGARIAVHDADGDVVATGPIHEPGWRHQLVVAPLGPGGAPELAVVRKPHVDKLLEFYRLDGRSLDVVATAEGFSSHTYRSRITDGAVAADLDDDGATEVIVPRADRTELGAVRRHEGGTAVPWTLSPPGTVRSNVTGIAPSDGGLAVGVGTDEGVWIWQG